MSEQAAPKDCQPDLLARPCVLSALNLGISKVCARSEPFQINMLAGWNQAVETFRLTSILSFLSRPLGAVLSLRQDTVCRLVRLGVELIRIFDQS